MNTNSHLMDESKISRVDLSTAKDREDFAFMKDPNDQYTAIEWEQREQALDRAWYDADEDGNVRYANDDLDDFMMGGGPTEQERAL